MRYYICCDGYAMGREVENEGVSDGVFLVSLTTYILDSDCLCNVML